MTPSTDMPSPATRLVEIPAAGRPTAIDRSRLSEDIGVSGSPSPGGGAPPTCGPSSSTMRLPAVACVDVNATSAKARLSVRMRIHRRFTLNRGIASFLFRLTRGKEKPQKRTKAPDLQRLGERTWIRGEAPPKAWQADARSHNQARPLIGAGSRSNYTRTGLKLGSTSGYGPRCKERNCGWSPRVIGTGAGAGAGPESPNDQPRLSLGPSGL